MPARKRAAPEMATDTSRRRSGRLSSTPKKSNYFEESEDDDGDDLPPRKRGRPAKKQAVAAKEESDEEQYQDEAAGDEDEEDKDEDEDDEDAPMKVEFIPLEKMRDTGGVQYEDVRIHKNTLLFLKDLKANNRRPWLKSHDGEYRRALKDWQSFVEAITQSLVEVDETIPELPVKDIIFRIHRDIRFTKDPTPYKAHFSAAWSRTGRKGPYACYYVHCEPGSSFLGGGLWHPEAQYVAKLRHSIDRHPGRWRRTLNAPLFKKVFLPDLKTGAGDEAAVKAFVGKNQANALKRKPKDYDITHPNIELLKLRNYTIGKKINADMLCREDAREQVIDCMRALSGFVSFLNSIVMPDPMADSDSDSDDDDDEGAEDEDEDEDEDGE